MMAGINNNRMAITDKGESSSSIKSPINDVDKASKPKDFTDFLNVII